MRKNFGDSVRRNRGIHNTHDTERGQIDNPANHHRNRIRHILQHGKRHRTCNFLDSKAHKGSPNQNTDIVRIGNRRKRIRHRIHQQIMQDFVNIGRHGRNVCRHIQPVKGNEDDKEES